MALLAFCLAETAALSAVGGDFLDGADAFLAEAKLGRLTSTFAAARAGESFVERAGEGFATFAGDLVLGAATLLDAFDTPLLFGGDLCVERAAAREGPLLFRLLLLTCGPVDVQLSMTIRRSSNADLHIHMPEPVKLLA